MSGRSFLFVTNSLVQVRNGLTARSHRPAAEASFRSLSILVWIVLLIIASPPRAAARVRPGVEVGLNYSSFNYYHRDQVPATYWDPGWRPSFTGGATLQVPIRGRFDLVTGVRYVQQGNRVRFDDGQGTLKGEFRMYLDYVSVPALLTYYPMAKRRFFVSLGPEIGLLVSAYTILEYTVPPLVAQYVNDKQQLERTNVTVDGSAGYEFPVENHVGVVSLRYARGVTGVAKNKDWLTDWDTRGIELSVGMRW